MALFLSPVYIGIDPTAGKKPINYAAFDAELHSIALAKNNLENILAFIAGYPNAIVAICAPQKPNMGLMNEQEYRDKLNPPPKPGRWRNYRVAEYMLRQHNIHITPTGKDKSLCPKWQQEAFLIYQRLAKFGYQNYPSDKDDRLVMEVYPQAAFTVLIGQRPLLKNTLEGRIQRQLILYENRVKISDAMIFFEEITRYRLIKGILPMQAIYTSQELDAMVAAYTAWLAHQHPDQITLMGEANEGQIVLPSKEIKSHY